MPLTVGAYYYAWYGSDGAHWDRGYLRSQLDTPEQPALGEYDSRDAGVIAQHYAWAHRYGVDVFFCSWAGPGGFDDLTIRDDLLPSQARGPTRIALLYESLQRLGLGPDNLVHLDEQAISRLVNDFDYLARTSFDAPGYYRIDGRPVVVLYASRIYRGPVAEAIAAVRQHLRTTFGIDPFLVGDEVDWNDPPDPARIRLFDAITGYTLYSRTQAGGWPTQTRFLQQSGRRLREFQAVAAAEGVAFIPGSLPGFNDRGVRPEDDHHVLPGQLEPGGAPGSLFASSLGLAGTLVDPRLRLLTVTSWNEWHEDTQIEPTAPAAPSDGPTAVTQGYPYGAYGFSLLDHLAQFKRSWERSSEPRSAASGGRSGQKRAAKRPLLRD